MYILLICFFILNLFDALITFTVLSITHHAESNPMMVMMINIGWLTFFFIKILISFLIIGIFFYLYKKDKDISEKGIIIINIIYIIILLNNTTYLLR